MPGGRSWGLLVSCWTARCRPPSIDRGEVYVTNAVKHFKYELRGKRRLHKKPAELEIAACHTWYESEVATVKPALIVAMGATAVRAVLGRALPILANRGTLLEPPNELPTSYASAGDRASFVSVARASRNPRSRVRQVR